MRTGECCQRGDRTVSTTETHLVWSCTRQRLDWRTGVTLRLAMSPQSMASLSLLHLVLIRPADLLRDLTDRTTQSPRPKGRNRPAPCVPFPPTGVRWKVWVFPRSLSTPHHAGPTYTRSTNCLPLSSWGADLRRMGEDRLNTQTRLVTWAGSFPSH